ncbi:MAG: dihydrofolate reductase family protein [Nocardioidaceae bacterium]
MRKVVLLTLLTVDGVAEAPELFVSDFDEVMEEHLARVISSQDTVVLGRRMHDEWAKYWPTSDDEPFASFINSVPKYVATSTPLTADWTNVSVIDGDPVDFVRALKAEPGGDIGVHGSIALSQSLLAAGVIDELELVVTPSLTGRGRRLFVGEEAQHLHLVRSTQSPTGSVVLSYRVPRVS